MKLKLKSLFITTLLLLVGTTVATSTFADDELPDPRVGDINTMTVNTSSSK
ncbi:hypothetical protein ACQKFO_19255 [Rossellomorea sp. NPDC071047]|jgi:hypothetical protein|uniref:hypothetical protein n=1 Tax=Rossellomorea sp. NPDC071047 TaxID=3390675 RepID=UPI003D06939D